MLKFLKDKGLFGWNYRHLLTHPWKLAEECYYHTKWFMQRGWRGYADCDVWGLDSYLAGWLPRALDGLISAKHGHPIGMTRKGWESRLKRMKQGLIEAGKIGDMKYKTVAENRAANLRMQRDLKLFVEHFHSLWD
jgi:hypothetical protein